MSWYGAGLVNLLTHTRTAARTIRVMLVAPGYTFDPDHTTVSQVTEISAIGGYVPGFAGAGRRTLSSYAVTYDATNNRLVFDCEDVVWSTVALSGSPNIGGVLVYIQGTSDADSTPLLFQNTPDIASNGQDITWSNGTAPSAGIGRITIQ
jgi:hypothetical protein